MRNLTMLALALAVAAGCGKSDKKEGGGEAAKTKDGKGAASGGDASAMITGTAPTLPPEVAAVKFGQPEADAKKAAGSDSGYVPSKSNKDVSYSLTSRGGKLESVSMTTKTDMLPVLTKAWGAPIKTEKEPYWFNPATGVRARIQDISSAPNMIVMFDSYEPIEKILGEKGNAFAMAGDKPLLGMTVDELKAALGDKLCRFDEEGPKLKEAIAEAEKDSISSLRNVQRVIHICNDAPRTVTGYTGLGDDVRFGLDGKVSSIHISFATGKSADLIKQLAATLDKTYGGNPSEVESDNGRERWYFNPAAKTQVEVSLGQDYIGVTYAGLLPVAELIGGDLPGLSVEGPHLPVGTPAQIKAADPAHYAQRGELAYLYYPPTEFSNFETEVSLLSWAHEKKTYGYRLNLHHTKNEAHGDKVFELLKAKFGEPKKDKQSTDKDVFWNFSKNGRKVQARRVSEQWQITVTK